VETQYFVVLALLKTESLESMPRMVAQAAQAAQAQAVQMSNKDRQHAHTADTTTNIDEYYEEVEVIEEQEELEVLPGIVEEDDEERSFESGPPAAGGSSVFSTTEVEVEEEDDLSEIFDETVEEVTEIGDCGSDIDEITLREEDLLLTEQDFVKCCQISIETNPNTRPVPEDEDEEEDGASSEELAEAIEYILRQEKAVSRYILTEDQAKVMTTLPLKIMRVIVDHLETCDNGGTEIDWDFLLKIVLPFCKDEDCAGDETDDNSNHDERVCSSVSVNYCSQRLSRA
jgi:hypothetical protein